MTLHILKESENKLFHRKELLFELEYSGSTPNKIEIKKSIAQTTKVSEDLVIIDTIHQIYGSTKAKINAKIYKTLEDLKYAEVINKKPKKTEEKKA